MEAVIDANMGGTVQNCAAGLAERGKAGGGLLCWEQFIKTAG